MWISVSSWMRRLLEATHSGPVQAQMSRSGTMARAAPREHGFSLEEEGTPFTTLYFLSKKQGRQMKPRAV
jgi:hypothetical protein